MKATITETFTGALILSDAADPEFSRIQSLSDLRKCENVLVEKQVKGCPFITIMIDDKIYEVIKSTFKHPYGGRETVFELVGY